MGLLAKSVVRLAVAILLAATIAHAQPAKPAIGPEGPVPIAAQQGGDAQEVDVQTLWTIKPPLSTKAPCKGTPSGAVFPLLPGGICPANQAGFSRAIHTSWSASAWEIKPSIVTYPRNAAEVSQVITWARLNNYKVSVRGHGHTGRSLANGSITIDTGKLTGIRAAGPRRNAAAVGEAGTAAAASAEAGSAAAASAGSNYAQLITFQAGVNNSLALEYLEPKGLSIPTGTHKSVGLFGLTLMGGQGYLTRRYGLMADQIVAAQIVTPDGRIRSVSENSRSPADKELFWGIRGAGQFLGVVTELTVKTYNQGPIWGGQVVYDITTGDDWKTIFTTWLDIRTAAFAAGERRLCIAAVLFRTPADQFATLRIGFVLFFDGSEAEANGIFDPLLNIAGLTPLEKDIGVKTFGEIEEIQTQQFPDGFRVQFYGRNVPTASFIDPSLAMWEALITECRNDPAIAADLEDYQGGAVRDVPDNFNAYGQRALSANALTVFAVTGSPSQDPAYRTKLYNIVTGTLGAYTLKAQYGNYNFWGVNRNLAFAAGSQYNRVQALINAYDRTKLMSINAPNTPGGVLMPYPTSGL